MSRIRKLLPALQIKKQLTNCQSGHFETLLPTLVICTLCVGYDDTAAPQELWCAHWKFIDEGKGECKWCCLRVRCWVYACTKVNPNELLHFILNFMLPIHSFYCSDSLPSISTFPIFSSILFSIICVFIHDAALLFKYTSKNSLKNYSEF